MTRFKQYGKTISRVDPQTGLRVYSYTRLMEAPEPDNSRIGCLTTGTVTTVHRQAAPASKWSREQLAQFLLDGAKHGWLSPRVETRAHIAYHLIEPQPTVKISNAHVERQPHFGERVELVNVPIRSVGNSQELPAKRASAYQTGQFHPVW